MSRSGIKHPEVTTTYILTGRQRVMLSRGQDELQLKADLAHIQQAAFYGAELLDDGSVALTFDTQEEYAKAECRPDGAVILSEYKPQSTK